MEGGAYMVLAEEKEVPEFSTFYGAKSGQVYYIVEFPQDESIELDKKV